MKIAKKIMLMRIAFLSVQIAIKFVMKICGTGKIVLNQYMDLFRGEIKMKKMNWKIGLGSLACASVIGFFAGLPLIIIGMWEEYVDEQNRREETLKDKSFMTPKAKCGSQSQI